MNLVTGGTGLLGSHIVEQLRKRNRPVRVLVRPGSDITWLKTQGVEFAEGDVTDLESLRRACRGADCIYHAAARVGANAVINVRPERSLAGRCGASGDAVRVRRIGEVEKTGGQDR